MVMFMFMFMSHVKVRIALVMCIAYPVLCFARRGVKIVITAVAVIPQRKTRLPPYLDTLYIVYTSSIHRIHIVYSLRHCIFIEKYISKEIKPTFQDTWLKKICKGCKKISKAVSKKTLQQYS